MFNTKEPQAICTSNMCNDENLSPSSRSNNDQNESDIEEALSLNIEKSVENDNFILNIPTYKTPYGTGIFNAKETQAKFPSNMCKQKANFIKY